MTNISRKGVWAIVLGALATATLIFFAWATSGFVNWNASSWFEYWGKGKPAVVRIAEPSVTQTAIALQSSNDVDHTLIFDSDEVSTDFTVQKPNAPHIGMSGFQSGDSLSISVAREYGDYTSGTITLDVYDYMYMNKYATYTFNVTPTEQVFSLNSTELEKLYANNNTNMLCFYARISDVEGYSGSNRTERYSVYNVKVDADFDFNYSGTTVSIPLNANIAKQNAYTISVGHSKGDVEHYDMSRPSDNKGSAITVEDSTAVIDLTKVDFIANGQAVIDPYISIRILSFQAQVTINGFYGDPGARSYFEVTKLDIPTNLKYNKGTLSWSNVSGANRYGVFWTDSDGVDQYAVVSAPTYTFDLNELGVGEYTVRVRALGNLGESIADGGIATMSLTPYNASNTITQLVSLTLSINGDNIVKLVPYGNNVLDYCSEVNLPGKEFGGWYYDNGFSRPVISTDVLNGDTTIYARLSDKKVAEYTPSWWDNYKWYVIAAIAVVAVSGVVAAVVIIRKKKAAA
ncbi:MAG: hypothetical protein K2O44_01545 [Clostridia bacterium]|nr:hypothetical protein [Clostridia bacterium]